MWKAAFVGAMALTIMGSSFVFAQDITDTSAARHPTRYGVQTHSSDEVDSKIARAKATLRLTPEQERHWPRVEAALREIARRKANAEEAGAGFMSRIGARASELALSASSIKRLVSAAQPLIKTLDDGQRRDAIHLARAMGLGSVAQHFE
ncbi:MAG: hypothetical protein M5U33_05085 [Pseudorhodoplanes sp.]|nr:hypothetical protein [Pseudorhodoplanes sp.]MCQ3941670.1 hypothetical protein [Alphaproteobacteria bacterium]MBW7950080.1 hypothetical protein [Pseudorhodoplanes sp.]MCL4712225.1 hypothetical protein [Pseudorhodoplanes sp.]MCZ7642223.1 hypothetical protein [Pseudorhodoplanes sp.]